MNLSNETIFITVEELYKHMSNLIKIDIISGAKGLKKQITSPHILEPEYLFSEHQTKNSSAGQILLISDTYLNLFSNFTPSKKLKVLKRMFTDKIACIILVSPKKEPYKRFKTMANYHKVPVLIAHSSLRNTLELISSYLFKNLSSKKRIHGVMMDISGVGVLIIGDSGVGKSENALDLVMRGHRLISDDIVELYENMNGEIIAASPELTKYHMEIRGLGIINIKELLGISAIGDDKKVNLIIELERWDEKKEYERLGWSMNTKKIMGKEFHLIKIPVAPGRNLSTIIEVAVRVFLLRKKGINPVREIDKRLREWNNKND